MKYQEIYEKAKSSYNNTLDMLVENTQPSLWHKQGRGWHEQWDRSPNCGVYASCQGLILLKQSNINLDKLIYNIYEQNLVLLFNKEIKIEKDRMNRKEMQRYKAINSTYKIAWFLYVSKILGRNNKVVKTLSSKLSKLHTDDGYFYKSTNKRDGSSYMASAFAFRALSKYFDEKKLSATQNIFVKTIEEYDKQPVKDIILALWALSDLQQLEELNEQKIENAIYHVFKYLDTRNFTSSVVFSNGIKENYNTDGLLIFYLSVLNMILSKKISLPNKLNDITEKIFHIAKNIDDNNGKYLTEGQTTNEALFWEHYLASQCLKKFCDIIEQNNKLMEKEFMIIEPQIFTEKNCTLNPKEVAVLMPFQADWSNNVFEIIKSCLQENSFEVWRADKDINDHIIMQDIWKNINSSSLIVADCTGKNPNVFYELGIAHTIGKTVFLCAQDINDFPFDIRHIRNYTYPVNDLVQLKNKLNGFLKEMNHEKN